MAKAIAQERGQTMGQVISEIVTATDTSRPALPIRNPVTGLPEFRCKLRVTAEDVKALDDEI